MAEPETQTFYPCS